MLLEPGIENAPVAPETFESHKAINQKPSELKDEFGVDVPVILLTEEELRPILKKVQEAYTEKDGVNNYAEFMEQRYKTRYIITLSKVGFNKERNQALLHIEHLCGAECAGGAYVFLQKQVNSWTIKRHFLTFVS
jgi:hypothetical protein